MFSIHALSATFETSTVTSSQLDIYLSAVPPGAMYAMPATSGSCSSTLKTEKDHSSGKKKV